MPIPLQSLIIYGPVRSRRLGNSLGINILPVNGKLCNFNCVYCQYGSTHGTWEKLLQSDSWPSKEIVLSELENSLRSRESAPDYLTLAGNGEPTIHPQFPELVDGIIELRDRYTPGSKTAILSNASLLLSPAVKRALMKLDAKILKLDCGNEMLFLKYNRPIMHVNFDALLQELKDLKDITIQTLFTGGEHGNVGQASLGPWLQRIKEISPAMVQIYSLDRDCEDRTLIPVSKDKLIDIQQQLRKLGVPSEVF